MPMLAIGIGWRGCVIEIPEVTGKKQGTGQGCAADMFAMDEVFLILRRIRRPCERLGSEGLVVVAK